MKRTTKQSDIYVDADGGMISLAGLDAAERRLVNRLRRQAKLKTDWGDYCNFCYKAVGDYYDARGVPRKVSRESIPFRIAQDLSGRIAVASGMARESDYRDDLQELIRERYRSARDFCRATGISPDMLSHVLAGRKDLSIGTLEQALAKIGYRLVLRPNASAPPARKRVKSAG